MKTSVRAPRILVAAGSLLASVSSLFAQADLVGEWSSPETLPVISVHTILLPTGKVMFYPISDAPYVWDPVSETSMALPKAGMNIFCSGHATLADGRVLIAGGHVVNGHGLPFASIYDPFSNSWSRQPDMGNGRWYPSQTALANGEQLILSGSYNPNYTVNPLPQVWQTDGTWRNLTNALRTVELYPRQFLAPNGKVFVAASTSRYLDTAGGGAWTAVSARRAADRSYGAAAMYDDGRIIFTGGGGGEDTSGIAPLNTAEIIDLNSAAPSWYSVQSMSLCRRQHNLTLLPDGCLLATGGSMLPGFDNPSGVVKLAELWNPWTQTWKKLASWPSDNYRGYHHTALLLPDGRILSSGGNGNKNYELFSPPYLYKGTRPVIASAPATITLGRQFQVVTPDRDSIVKVTLVRLGAVTHSFNMDQRINFCTFGPTAETSDGLDIFPPISPNNCPPGYYMVFLINSNGVPSLGQMAMVTTGPASAYQQDTTSNGAVVIEAENWDRRIISSGRSWTTTFNSGYSGVRAVRAMPNTGKKTDTDYVTAAPRLDYRVNFVNTGTHYVWIRGLGMTTQDDTCHVGLDGLAVSTANRMGRFSPNWTWSRSTLDGPVATLQVIAPGLHTINLWMRDDGFIFDKIMVVTNANFVPTGTGPTQSWRQ